MNLNSNSQSKILFFFSIIISIFYIFFTNSFFNFDQSLVYGAADGATYMEITKNFPNITENGLAYSHNQRFLIPYLMGFINSFLNLEFFLVYRYSASVLFFLILYFFYKNLSILKTSYLEKYFALSLIIFNPYLLRYYISLPTLINDLVFILSTQLIIYSFLSSNRLFSHLGLYLSFFARQTGIFLLITFLFQRIYFKDKSLINFKDIFIFISIFISIFLLNDYYADIASGGKAFFSEHSGDVYGLLIFFYYNFDLNKLLYFLSFPFLNWTPVIIFCLLRRFKLNERYREISSFIIVSSVLIFLQPIFAGPDVVLKNLIRLTNLAYPMVILYIFSNSSFRILNKKIAILLSIPFFLFWSSHPTYSIFDFLNFN